MPSARPMTHFSYEVVTSNGAGVHSKHLKLSDALAAMERHVARHRKLRLEWDDYFEIQRRRYFPGGSCEIDMRQRHRWVTWDPKGDFTDREPDYGIHIGPQDKEG